MLIFLISIVASFYFAPPIVDKVAELEHISFSTTFGNVRPQLMKLCGEKDDVLIESAKDQWGEKIDFIWRDDGTVLLRSAGEDKLKDTSDDLVVVTSCTDREFKLKNKI